MMGSLATIPQPTLLALAAVIIIGLPHGALDGAIAIYLGYSKRVVLLLRFVLLYVVAAALVVAAWMAAPAVCLLIFLVISMLHFGLGDARPGGGWEGFLEAVAHGGLVVAGISLIHRDEVDVIFGYLVGGSTQMVWQGLEILAVIIAIALAFCVVKGVADRRWRAGLAELLLLCISVWSIRCAMCARFCRALLPACRAGWSLHRRRCSPLPAGWLVRFPFGCLPVLVAQNQRSCVLSLSGLPP